MKDTVHHSKVRNSVGYCKQLLDSLQCGVGKADRGSTVEDDYILEKLEKFANVFNKTLVKKTYGG